MSKALTSIKPNLGLIEIKRLVYSDKKNNRSNNDMENAEMATQILANIGLFLGGIGLIWIATLYRGKKE